MIVSASRRTDIPAFYSEWLMKRLEEGFVYVRNPMNRRQVSRIPLNRETVDCMVFWTKHPGPMLPRLPALDAMGFPYYFQFTLTPYGRDLEPGLPEKHRLLEQFSALWDRLGPERTVWRYDPIFLSGEWGISRHLAEFERFCARLEGKTETCVVSFLDGYRKIAKTLERLNLRPPDHEERLRLMAEFGPMAAARGISVQTCAEEQDFLAFGVKQGACIDPELIQWITGRPVTAGKDPGQRPGCGCARSVDIGTYDTCAHFCAYCYANLGREAVEGARRRYQADSPFLCDRLEGDDRVTERKMPSVLGKGDGGQMSLFE